MSLVRGNSPFSVRTDVTGFLVVALAKPTSATAGTMIGLAITRERENKSVGQSDRLAELEHKQDENFIWTWWYCGDGSGVVGGGG